ncbi:MAG TPA: response regulator [Verrucomicrobiae bacterium]|nr:response regulator [Verrucomicrobiae bacterium]
MAKLVVITKGLAPVAHELGEGWVTIGRGDGNSFQLVEPSISGRHCEVRVRGSELVVRDLLSSNGTFIDGKKISEAVLHPGQTVCLGEVELRFEAAASPVNPAAAAALKVQAVSSSKPAASKPSLPGEAAKKYHVLFVDDSMAFIETFGGLCQEFSHHAWEILSATTADRALAVLQEGPIDLVILDIGMPMVDGIQLLGIVSRRYPGLKIAVMTGRATEAHRAASLAGGAELFIEKPVTTDATRVVFNLLHDMLAWAHRDGFSGALRQVGLLDVVQMECVSGHSSLLEIRNSELRGQIFIEAGAITHATVGNLAGKQAFYRLLSLKGGEFQVKAFTPPPQHTIQERWEVLLMDAARNCDEETAFITKIQAAAASAGAAPASAPAPAHENKTSMPAPAPDKNFVVVSRSEGKWIPTDGSKK